MFPHQEPCVRGPPSKDLYQVLRGGSSYTQFLMREHGKQETPPGGGFLSINIGFTELLFFQIDLYSVSTFLLFCSKRCDWALRSEGFLKSGRKVEESGMKVTVNINSERGAPPQKKIRCVSETDPCASERAGNRVVCSGTLAAARPFYWMTLNKERSIIGTKKLWQCDYLFTIASARGTHQWILQGGVNA